MTKARDLADLLDGSGNLKEKDGRTLSGRNVKNDGGKLDGIEAAATADQDHSEIRALIAIGVDTNVFTDADHTKLNAIEASATADQTDAEIRAAVEAATNSNVFTDADHTKLNAIEASATADQTNAEIRTAVESATNSNVFTDADHTKLNAIEAGATADQTKSDIDALNINADTLDGQHGSYYTGYTDTAVANIVDSSPAALNTLNELAAALGDDPNFATTTSTNIGTKLPKAGGAMTGAITTNSTFDGRNVSVDGTKLDGIEAGANVTDTANVVAALTAGSNITISAGGTIAGAAQYTHPTHAGDDAAIDTGALSGATVISDLDLNITTDTLGHVTDANATVSTRNLTLANLGYTGETNATADQTAAQLLTAIKTVDGAGNGLDADLLDGVEGASFLRSDANDTFSGSLTSTHRSNGIFGSYNSSKTDHIWSMGTAYKNSADGSDFGNLYGFAYKHTNNSTGGTMAGGHQAVWCDNGTPKAAMGSNGLWAAGSLTIGDRITHDGDINTYIQFHAADQFRVVTGGNERLEVNNSRTQIDNLLVTGTATFSGTVAGAGASNLNSLTDCTVSTSEPAINTNPSSGLGHLWVNTTRGHQYILIDATSNANVWKNVGVGTGSVGAFEASGGTVSLSADGLDKIHTFTSSGNFVVTGKAGNCEVLIVGGGGGAGGGMGGGGGGGTVYKRSVISLGIGSHSIVIAAGGAGGNSSQRGTNGGQTTAFGLTALGGGGGGYYSGITGLSGANGGGGGPSAAGGSGSINSYSGWTGYGGNSGGTGGSLGSGGGGGATAAGQSGGMNLHDGGAGVLNAIYGPNFYWGGGGGGHSYNTGPAGVGGRGGAGGGSSQSAGEGPPGVAGADGFNAGEAGLLEGPGGNAGANTGSGGGGSFWSNGQGGAGGSGIVIVRFTI